MVAIGRAKPVAVGAIGVAVLLAVGPMSVARVVAPSAGSPSFVSYPTPPNLRQHAGEPSIGVDLTTGKAMFEALESTLRVSFDDTARPATATWEDKSAPSSVTTFDPILFVDPTTGRTFVSQLTIACSLASYSNDDGDSWVGPTQGCGVGPPEDHQSIGGGPYHSPAPLGAGLLYPHSVYYCHQDGVLGNVLADGQAAYCALSVTGGDTFGPDVPIYTALQCGGLHGHIKVGPDGTAYVPNQGCDMSSIDPSLPGETYAHQAVVVSEDNGTTWSVHSIPDSRATPYSDPSVGVGRGNAVYFGYQDGGNADGTGRHPKIAISHDHGRTWTRSIDVGSALHIENVEFPEVVVGDDDRAAFAFLGTTKPGDDQAATFNGIWHLYVSYTYDGGTTWTTVDATPHDPVQRGCIELIFPTSHCPHRNLLDFNDATIDRDGRVLVAYADGCTDRCVDSPARADNTYTDLGVIARQACGKGLFAAGDGKIPTCAASVAAVREVKPGVKPNRRGGTATLPATGVETSYPTAFLLLAGAVVAACIRARLGIRRLDRRTSRSNAS